MNDIETKTIPLNVACRLTEHLGQEVQWRTIVDDVTKELVYKFSTTLEGEHLGSVEYTHPLTWWDALIASLPRGIKVALALFHIVPIYKKLRFDAHRIIINKHPYLHAQVVDVTKD